MKIGFHVSIAGGFSKVVERALERKCATVQFFSRNPRAWAYKPLIQEDIKVYKEKLAKSRIAPIFIHMPYLVNLASGKTDLFQRSLDSVIIELERAAALKAQYIIMHIGSCPDEKKGIIRTIKGINKALKKVKNNVVLLLENTAHSGHELGYNFQQISCILNQINEMNRVGIVLDTAHAFAAGYDLHTMRGVNKTLRQLSNTIGIDRLKLVHLNDSKAKLGSRRDQHWHIGKGHIGKGLGYVLRHTLLKNKPFIMETPRQSRTDDLNNLRKVREYLNKTQR